MLLCVLRAETRKTVELLNGLLVFEGVAEGAVGVLLNGAAGAVVILLRRRVVILAPISTPNKIIVAVVEVSESGRDWGLKRAAKPRERFNVPLAHLHERRKPSVVRQRLESDAVFDYHHL